MNRRTSEQAYAAIVASGWISDCRKKVYAYLYREGPRSRNEIDRALSNGEPNPPYSRRLVEMERMGILARVGTRKSEGSPACDLWDVTDALPSKPQKRSVRRAPLASVVAKLSSLLNHPRANVFPDATLEAARAILDGAEPEQTEATS